MLLNNGKLISGIEQGYDDAQRCIGHVAQVLAQQARSKSAIAQRNAALSVLDDDDFLLS